MELFLVIFIYLFVLNFIGYVISAPLKTERLYDLSGSLSFGGAVIISFIMSSQSTRHIVLLVLVLVWALRMGYLLGLRAFTIGDKRFDAYKVDPIIFACLWTGQIAWTVGTCVPVYLVMRDTQSLEFGTPTDIVGLILFIIGFTLEVSADYQKGQFKKTNPKDPIMTGLYKFVRFPNYLGEWILWIGINILSISGWQQPWEYVGLVSIPFVFVLVRFGSGAGITAPSQQERYGDRPEFQEYCRKTKYFFQIM